MCDSPQARAPSGFCLRDYRRATDRGGERTIGGRARCHTRRFTGVDVRMSDEIANFRKVGNKLKSEKSKKSNRNKNSDLKRQIENATDLIFLDVPNNLLKLEVDEYYMVKLTKTNSEIVEHELANDISYPQKAKKICEELIKRNNDFSSKTFNIIIHRIAIENSTGSSKKR